MVSTDGIFQVDVRGLTVLAAKAHLPLRSATISSVSCAALLLTQPSLYSLTQNTASGPARLRREGQRAQETEAAGRRRRRQKGAGT
jgi:hypothetical protein